jgi:hypothetical protein
MRLDAARLDETIIGMIACLRKLDRELLFS